MERETEKKAPTTAMREMKNWSKFRQRQLKAIIMYTWADWKAIIFFISFSLCLLLISVHLFSSLDLSVLCDAVLHCSLYVFLKNFTWLSNELHSQVRVKTPKAKTNNNNTLIQREWKMEIKQENSVLRRRRKKDFRGATKVSAVCVNRVWFNKRSERTKKKLIKMRSIKSKLMKSKIKMYFSMFLFIRH